MSIKHKLIKWVLNIVIGILVMYVIILTVQVVQRQIAYENTNEVYEELKETIKVEQPHPSNLATLKGQNPDTVGWIEIPDTAIQYPVMKAEDNLYYLEHSFEKEESLAGSIYMDYRNDPLFTDQNTVIYGHDMKNGSMFHNLRYMRKQDYVDQHSSIVLMIDDEILEYEIFSVYPTEAEYDYRTPNYEDVAQYQDFLRRIKERSIIVSDIVPHEEDQILTLSTCAYDFEDGRLAVHARLKK